MPSIFAVGDIHGCLTALETLLAAVQLLGAIAGARRNIRCCGGGLFRLNVRKSGSLRANWFALAAADSS